MKQDGTEMVFNKISPQKVLIFDIMGPMAHFRKYYTNSSSLSYLVPPRTVIIGLIAGILGFPSEKHTESKNDVYYEKLNYDNCFVAVSNKTKTRKIMQTVNYLKITRINHVNGSGGGTQIPLEILLSEGSQEVVYRVYFSHRNESIYNALKNRLKDHMFVYPPYLGLTEFLASIDYIGEGSIEKNLNEKLEISSVCKIKEIELDFSDRKLQYVTEKMPTDFLNDRTPLEPAEYVSEINGGCIKIKRAINSFCYSVRYLDSDVLKTDNIIFM
ncbi:type I-B CRISPR-associated protein Cas5b [Methanosarcina sp. UBA411]|jgi:CRISPR-associated protein Cas5h|uniref:type I-B CRISPR-associated protein Cas5b n=1 Tax=Methanosarcina sp. UBA411 TaxID=1915589 RepID=UPI0025CE0384|nr:type I-B CRISPR-associated protein Cas5b [Methanosarcina sp. UBA411]